MELGAFAKTAPDSTNEDRVIVIKALCCTKECFRNRLPTNNPFWWWRAIWRRQAFCFLF